MADLPPLRLMGPAERHAFHHLTWVFARGNNEWSSNQLVFWTDTRQWEAHAKARSLKFVDQYSFWPHVPVEELKALLPDEELAKAAAALIGVLPEP